MGSTISSYIGPEKPKIKFYIGGMDEGGKTTLLYWYTMNKCVETTHTVGFNKETFGFECPEGDVVCEGVDPGRGKMERMTWKEHYEGSDALIFVVHGGECGHQKWAWCEEDLEMYMRYDNKACLLVLVNTPTEKHPPTNDEIIDKLHMRNAPWLVNRQWIVMHCDVKTGVGVSEGLRWVVQSVQRQRMMGGRSASAYI
eukprot:GDKI01012970.1.p1 GENE.GDKI01012970.1~~GDKI01012970.1.p1  ORF type:complete len:198 (-),score=41.39 GDKI01012970.1:157-750(-)